MMFITLAAYLLGSVNPAYLIAKAQGFDIRKRGSKNAGASNALILMGKKAAVITALLDIFKAYLTVTLARIWLPHIPYAGMLAGAACILGHIFPVFMSFRGGKGLACLGGVILAYHPVVFLVLLLSELILVLIVDYICIVPISASIAFPIIYYGMMHEKWGTLILCVVMLVVLYKHIENLKRIRNGTEAHFSFLWRRNQEIDRLQGKFEDPAVQEDEEKHQQQ